MLPNTMNGMIISSVSNTRTKTGVLEVRLIRIFYFSAQTYYLHRSTSAVFIAIEIKLHKNSSFLLLFAAHHFTPHKHTRINTHA